MIANTSTDIAKIIVIIPVAILFSPAVVIRLQPLIKLSMEHEIEAIDIKISSIVHNKFFIWYTSF